MSLRVRLDELLPAKTAARALPQALRRLESGDAQQLVITNRNEPRAVLITAPTPVATAQLMRAMTSSGASLRTLIAPETGTTTSSAYEETPR